MSWEQQLNKSRINNQQLEFSNHFTLSYINTNQPDNVLVKCRHIQDGNIFIYIDGRSNAYQLLSKNVALLWHFPLSREIYQIKALQETVDDVEQFWNQLDKEERKQFLTKNPNQIVDQVAEKQLTDVEKFNMQNRIEVSANFKVVKITPYDVVLTKQTMPQVIADSRTKFESIFRPYKEEQKIHYEKKENNWISNNII